MAISDSQKVDYLWKKLGYGKAKTDTNAFKESTNEAIDSPLLMRGDIIWAQADLMLLQCQHLQLHMLEFIKVQVL